MNVAPRFRLTEEVIAGALLVHVGALFILDNLRLVDAGSLWDYRPLLLVARRTSCGWTPCRLSSRSARAATWPYSPAAAGFR